MHADLTSSINNSGHDDTDGTVTPTLNVKKYKKYSDTSIQSDASSGTRMVESFDKEPSNISLTESEYYTARSGFTTDSNASPSNRK